MSIARYHKQRLQNKTGVTLVEVLVTILLFTFLMGIALSILSASSDSWETNKRRTEMQQEMRKAVDWIKEDLRQTGLGGISNAVNSGGTTTPLYSDGTPYGALWFKKSTGVSGGVVQWSSDIEYYLDTNQLKRSFNGDIKTIATNISNLQFSHTAADPRLIVVTVTASRAAVRGGGTITLNYTFNVKVRN